MPNLIEDNTPFRVACKDISKDIRKDNQINNYKDIWIVTPKMLDNKITRHLNRLLGINKINKFGYHMQRNKTL